MKGLHKKKPKRIEKQVLLQTLKIACKRRVLAKVASRTLQFPTHFLDFVGEYLIMENTLSHLDDVRQLRDQDLVLYFPFRSTLLKGTIRLIGLTTHKNIRSLQFSLPPYLVTDEKRSVKRVYSLPIESSLTFSTVDLKFYQGRILNLSPAGMAFVVSERVEEPEQLFRKGRRIQAEAVLGDAMRFSFDAEVRHVSKLGKTGIAGNYRLGVRMLNLLPDMQERLNQWLFKISAFTHDDEDEPRIQTEKKVRVETDASRSIVVIGPNSADLDFWYQCLGRKYEVITSDANMANIRVALSTGAALVLMYMDAHNPGKASFTRKLCGSLVGRHAILFFGEESDPERQQTLTGSVPNHGFLDMNERKILSKFRTVDEIMRKLSHNPSP